MHYAYFYKIKLLDRPIFRVPLLAKLEPTIWHYFILDLFFRALAYGFWTVARFSIFLFQDALFYLTLFELGYDGHFRF